jgi:triacylglycerol lipase
MPALKFNPNSKSFDLVNAQATAKASQLAYSEEEDILKTLKTWGFSQATFFSNREVGTQGFVAGNADMILVAFRGTEVGEIKDWKSDANIKLVPGKGGGHVHIGFKKALEAVSSEMAAAVREYRSKDQPVFVTGHSLGAALAGLAVAAAGSERVEIAGLYTYGMPRVGNKTFADRFMRKHGKRAYRIVNNNDIVTRVPPSIVGYKHVGMVKTLNASGKLESGDGPWKNFKRKVKGQFKGRAEDLFKPGSDGLKDHGIKKYIGILNKLGA